MKKFFADRFWYRVRITPGCWEWIGGKDSKGYGNYSGGPGGRAHIVAYANLVGHVPIGMCVCHHCDNPACVNPDHLFLGTKNDNNKDRHAKGRTSRMSRNVGSKHGMSVIDEDIARRIVSMKQEGMRQVDIASNLSVSTQLVSLVVQGKRWNHATGVSA